MKHALLAARILLGLPFLVFGLNTFLLFMEPDPQPERAQAFLDALTDARFAHPLRAAIEVTSGALLVLGLWVPLALVMLAPVLANIVGYHLYLDDRPGALGMNALIVVLFLVVAWTRRQSFAGLFQGAPKREE